MKQTLKPTVANRKSPIPSLTHNILYAEQIPTTSANQYFSKRSQNVTLGNPGVLVAPPMDQAGAI